MKSYKVVPGPMGFTVKKGNSSKAFSGFEDIINRETTGGWTYHSMEIIEVDEKLGCIEILLTRKMYETSRYYMLIFEKEESGRTVKENRSVAIKSEDQAVVNDNITPADVTEEKDVPSVPVCPSCGAPQKENAKFCTKCGHKLI